MYTEIRFGEGQSISKCGELVVYIFVWVVEEGLSEKEVLRRRVVFSKKTVFKM